MRTIFKIDIILLILIFFPIQVPNLNTNKSLIFTEKSSKYNSIGPLNLFVNTQFGLTGIFLS